MSDTRRPPPPPQRPSETDDVTWLDFLRTAGGTVPTDNNNSTSTDRKRRHAGSSPERRTEPYPGYTAPPPPMTGRRPSGMNMASVPGSSRDNAIDLTSSPRPQPFQRPQIAQRSNPSNENLRAARSGIRLVTTSGSTRGNTMPPRRESDVVLPPWQPDSDVSRCPVCSTEFHFFYRKHHCRKCGRVVCAACSPHRITIPRQYIVQPPSSSDSEQAPSSPVSGGGYNRNLGGGEVVRVCNPCVPDPWTPNTAPNEQSRPQQDSGRSRENQGQFVVPDRFRYPPDAATRARAHSHQPPSNYPAHPNITHSGFVQREPYNRPLHSHRYTQSSSNASFPPMPPGQMPQPVPPPPPPQHTRPRREIREEDECPVCGMELPPGESVREAHIQECITLRFSSTPSSSSLPTHTPAIPPPRTSSMPSTTPSSIAAIDPSAAPSGPSTPPVARARATSYRPRGMAIYKATEKDCLTEDGEPQECVICFEEFQPGDEMGRMECLCKFHRLCIRRWWDTKGTGSCPTHQLHD